MCDGWVACASTYRLCHTFQHIPKLQVIVQVSLAALCGSDIHLYTGKDDIPDCGTVMGHEFVGTVCEVHWLKCTPPTTSDAHHQRRIAHR